MTKEFWPGTDIERSTNNGFTIGFGTPIDWAKITANAAASAKCTKNVERRRKAGDDHSTFHGISRKSDANIKPFRAHRPQGDSKAARIRELLKACPMDSVAIAAVLGIKGAHARALMQYDVEQGSVVKLREYRPIRYALAEAA